MYGSKTREQQLEAALSTLVDLFDTEVLVISPDADNDDRGAVDEAIEAAAFALTLDEEDEDFARDTEVE